MALDPLATADDLAGRLGRDLSDAEIDQVEFLLADASAAVRAYCGQEFSLSESTVRVRVRGGAARLPQRPVVSVATAADTDENDVDFTWYGSDRVTISKTWLEWVDVTYTHGYEEIPGEIVAVVCQVVGRALGRPADQTGLSSETIGQYSYQVGGAAAAGTVGMLADEKAVLDRYRRVGGTASVLT